MEGSKQALMKDQLVVAKNGWCEGEIDVTVLDLKANGDGGSFGGGRKAVGGFEKGQLERRLH